MIVPRLNRRSNLCSTDGVSNECLTKVNPGSMAARDPWWCGRMRPRPDHARVVVSTGDGVDPPQHLASTWKPTYPWLRTSRHWTKPLPINAYVIEHRDGIMLFDTARTGRRSPTRATSPAPPPNPLRPPRALRHRPRQYAHRPARGHRLRPRRCANCGAVPSPPGPHRRAAGAPRCRHRSWSAARSGSSYNNRWEPRGLLRSHIQLPGLHWRRIELAPTDDPGLVPFTAGHPLFGDGSLVLPPTPGHTPGSLSMLVRRPGRPSLLLAGDLTHDAHLLEHGHLPGVGSWTICRARCAG
jgi:N-acyl homoserine lactone hydrolase